MAYLKIIFHLQILLLLIILINSSQFQNIHFLISAKLNGTSPGILLNSLEPNQTYLYFLFDFNYHNSRLQNSKNVAYFQISTNLNIPIGEELIKNAIAYRLTQKTWFQIKNKKVANNIMYKKVPILLKEEKDNIYNYYFKIEKNDDKKITLIIRVPTQGKKKGFLDIYNILELPTIRPKIKN